jgi:hypothetical protein
MCHVGQCCNIRSSDIYTQAASEFIFSQTIVSVFYCLKIRAPWCRTEVIMVVSCTVQVLSSIFQKPTVSFRILHSSLPFFNKILIVGNQTGQDFLLLQFDLKASLILCMKSRQMASIMGNLSVIAKLG